MDRESVIRKYKNTHQRCTVLEHDLYNIAERIRRIDDGYFIVRNHHSKKWEVHHTENYPTTYSFLVPFDFLDERTLSHCLMTSTANTEKLLKEMNENNEKIKKSADRKRQNEIEAISLETAKDIRRAI